MRHSVLWGMQATVDRTFRVGDKCAEIAGEWVRMGILKEFHETLRAIGTTGLPRDMNFRVPKTPDGCEDIKRALAFLQERFGKTERAQIGGNPGISALRGYRLAAGNPQSKLPYVQYVGLYPKSVQEYVQDSAEREPELRNVFNSETCIRVDAEPRTVAIEGEHKIILAYAPGRDVTDLYQHRGGAPAGGGGRFDPYVQRLCSAVRDRGDGHVVIALAVPFPLDEGREMMSAIRQEFGHAASIFVGVSSFRSQTGELDLARVEEISEKILSHADIISCNETELDDLHTALVGEGVYKDIALPYKLKELPLRAIKMCHSADGAILEVGCNPQTVIKSERFQEKPGEYLTEALRLATDGATYAIDSATVGRSASESMVRIYSNSITDRRAELFRATFQKAVERLPGGIVHVPAPFVGRPMGALTGVGAMLDGLFLSFLMRD